MVYFCWNSYIDSGDVAIDVTNPSNRVPQSIITPRSSKGYQILKSLVYGGLAELLASIIFTLIWCNIILIMVYFCWNSYTDSGDVIINVTNPSNRVPQPIITPRSSK